MLLNAGRITMEVLPGCDGKYISSLRSSLHMPSALAHSAGRIAGLEHLSRYLEASRLRMKEQTGVGQHTRKSSRAQRSESMLAYLNRIPTWTDNRRNTTFVWIV